MLGSASACYAMIFLRAHGERDSGAGGTGQYGGRTNSSSKAPGRSAGESDNSCDDGSDNIARSLDNDHMTDIYWALIELIYD